MLNVPGQDQKPLYYYFSTQLAEGEEPPSNLATPQAPAPSTVKKVDRVFEHSPTTSSYQKSPDSSAEKEKKPSRVRVCKKLLPRLNKAAQRLPSLGRAHSQPTIHSTEEPLTQIVCTSLQLTEKARKEQKAGLKSLLDQPRSQ